MKTEIHDQSMTKIIHKSDQVKSARVKLLTERWRKIIKMFTGTLNNMELTSSLSVYDYLLAHKSFHFSERKRKN